MTMTNFGGNLVVPNLYDFAAVGLPTVSGFSQALNAAAARNAYVFRVPKSGTLDWFEIRTGTVPNNPDNGLRFSFQNVTAAGIPDNTEDQFVVVAGPFTANTWVVPATVMTDDGTPGGVKRTVTAGEYLACVVRLENFVASDSLNCALINGNASGLNAQGTFQTAYQSANSGTAWTANADNLIIALKYDDGTYGFAQSTIIPVSIINSRTINTGTVPDEAGLLFQVPVPCRLKGFYFHYDSNGFAHDFKLYDAAGSVLETVTGLTWTGGSGGSAGYGYYEFATPHDLTENVNYRITLLPTTASSLAYVDFEFNSSAIRAALDGGSTWMKTERTNAGAWTDTNTIRPLVHLVFGGFDDASGGGGGEHSAVF